MKAIIYKVFRFLRQRKLCPWCIWSPIYDACHDAVDDAWVGEA